MGSPGLRGEGPRLHDQQGSYRGVVDPATLIDHACFSLGVGPGELARLLGVDRSCVYRWQTSARSVPGPAWRLLICATERTDAVKPILEREST